MVAPGKIVKIAGQQGVFLVVSEENNLHDVVRLCPKWEDEPLALFDVPGDQLWESKEGK